MNTPTRATPENWEFIKDRADRHGIASDRALCDINAELEAYTVIDVVAGWLERKQFARIASGGVFADLLRAMLDREAGR